MFIELQAAYLVLSKWKQNPAATKREIRSWAHWRHEGDDNQRPISPLAVEQMKTLPLRYAPSSHSQLFATELKPPPRSHVNGSAIPLHHPSQFLALPRAWAGPEGGLQVHTAPLSQTEDQAKEADLLCLFHERLN